MIVYGDHAREAAARPELESLRDRLRAWNEQLDALPVERHGALVDLLVDVGALAQGLLDHAYELRGRTDDLGELEARVLRGVSALAEAVVRSIDAGHVPPEDGVTLDSIDALLRADLPERVRIKVPEGFAFYALYPESYVAAARQLRSTDVQCIGLRSIGVTLAAVVKAAVGSGHELITVRPQGHPFSRTLKVGPALEARIAEAPAAHFAIVDEGPGLSGSSFAAAGRWLRDRGIREERIHFLPSHPGEPGAAATEETRAAWRTHPRQFVPFERAFHPEGARAALARWAEDLIGPVESLEDLSGGAWRTANTGWQTRAELPPVHLQQERRKYLARSDRGTWLLKFTGLGRSGAQAFERARRLGEAGFGPPALARRNGFLVQPWLVGAEPLTQSRRVSASDLTERVGRYLAFRARSLEVPAEPGASVRVLYEMARYNSQRALGERAEQRLAEHEPRLARLEQQVRPIATDNRMHSWEWLVTTEGEVLKTDGADHCQGHDLIGSQDVAWDVVGACMELGLPEQELCEALVRNGGPRPSQVLLDFYADIYAAYHLGHWTLAADSQLTFAPQEAARCRTQAAKYAQALLRGARRERARG